jgi:hypothetical protein
MVSLGTLMWYGILRNTCLITLIVGHLMTSDVAAQHSGAVALRSCSNGPVIVNDALQRGDTTWLAGPQGSVGSMTDPAKPISWTCLPVQFDVRLIDAHMDTIYVAGSEGNLWYRAGGTWRRRPLPTQATVTSAASNDGRIVLVADDNTVMTMSSLQAEIDVLEAPSPDGQWRDVARHGDTIVLVGQRSSLAISTDAGLTWRRGPKATDTLQWNVVHRLRDGRWLLGGDGARVVYMDAGLTTFLKFQRVFPSDPRPQIRDHHRVDGIDRIMETADGRLWLGGRTFAANLYGIGPTHGLYHAMPDADTWTKVEFISELRPDGEAPILVDRCIGIVPDPLDVRGVRAVVSSAWNGGGVSTIHACTPSQHLSTIVGLHTPHRVLRDAEGAITGIAAQHFVGIAQENDTSFYVISNPTWVTPFDRRTPPPSMLQRVVWSTTSVNCRFDTLRTFPNARLTSLALVGNALLIGDDSCSIHRSVDAGLTWTSTTPVPGVLGISGFRYAGDRVMTIANGMEIGPRPAWAGIAPLWSSNAGATWNAIPLPPAPDSALLAIVAYKVRRDGTVWFAVSTRDERTEVIDISSWIIGSGDTLSPGPPFPDSVSDPRKAQAISMSDGPLDVVLLDLVMPDSSTVTHKGVWTGTKWELHRTRFVNAEGLVSDLPTRFARDRFNFSPQRSFTEIIGILLESTDQGITWRKSPRYSLFTPFGLSIGSVLQLPSGQISASVNGIICYLPYPATTSTFEQPTSASMSSVDRLDVRPEDLYCLLIDLNGRQHVIDLHQRTSNSIDLTQLGLSPGVYGVTIGHGRDLRRQTVLITR